MTRARRPAPPKALASKTHASAPPSDAAAEPQLFDLPPAATDAEATPDMPTPAGADESLVPLSDGPLKRLVDDNFLRYASYVIRDRAIPDLADGLKPVQRRILHALQLVDDGKFHKVANIVGQCMQFHPHGDASIEEALTTLANKRYLIEGQGNFGNLLTGDPPAAARYIECRLTELARDELFDEDLTETVPTYDGRRREPVTLPARLPLLLLLGAEGIAVGLATRILPHNLNELLEAQVAILHDKPFEVYPDFAQGGLMDVAGYDRGRGAVRVRARIEIRDPQTLVIRALPFGATSDSLIASIEDAARKGKLKLRGINDFTAEQVEIEVRLQDDTEAPRAIEALYAFTQCESAVASRIVAIRDGRPVELDVEDVLRHNTERLLDLLRRGLRRNQKQAGEELHRKLLVQRFIETRLYRAVEACDSPEAMEQAVREGLAPHRAEWARDLTRADIEMLLALPIRRISQFDLARNRAEMDALRERLAETGRDLANLVPYAVRYLRNLQRKYGALEPRRTEIARFDAVALRELTATELTINHDREKGYIGTAVKGEPLLRCSSLDRLLLLWRDGRCKVVAPPDKLFVDTSLLKVLPLDRERVLLAVFRDELFTRIKRFTIGGTILNREYRCLPKGAEIRFLADDDPPTLYVRYAVMSPRDTRQQTFEPRTLPVKDRAARGAVLTGKIITHVGAERPADWDDAASGPPGAFMDFA